MFLCLLKYSSGKEKLNDTSIVFNWIFMPPILNVLSSSSKEALPSLHPFLIQSFCWNTELFLWNTKKVAAHFLSQKPTLYPAPLWDPDDRFRSSGTNLSSSIKTSWQFLKEKKNRRRKYQLLSVEKKSQRTQLFVLQKSNSHQQHSSTISIRKLMNWDTLWKQNGWTEKYFIAEK